MEVRDESLRENGEFARVLRSFAVICVFAMSEGYVLLFSSCKMLVYTDLISGDQVLSDSFPWKELDFVVDEAGTKLEGVMIVQSKKVVKDIGEVNTGANASAENPEEEAVDDSVEKVCDITDGLVGFGYEGPLPLKAAEFVALYKQWCQAVKAKKVEAGEKPGPFMKSAKGFMQFVKKEFKNFEIYAPKSFNTETFIIGWWDEEANAAGSPKFIYFKHALKEEKY